MQPTHRVVPEYVLSESIADVSSGNKEKNKTKKKDRSEKKHKSSKKSSIQEENLLGLDNVVSNNLLAVDNRDSTSNGVSKIDRVSHIDDDSNGKSAKKNKSKSSDKKKSSSTAWLPLYCDDHIDVLHSIEANMELQTITIQTKVINNRSDGFPVSVIMEIQPSTSYQVKVSNRLSIADKLACGENSKLSIDLTTVSNVITGSIPLAGDLIIMNDSLLGSEKVSKPFDTSITICSTLTPNKVSEESFMAAVGKPSSRWENTTAQITTATKPKSAFKTLAAIFNAAIVETESSKAANMTAKVKNGSIKGTIYFLVKAVSDGISIDIKCLCGSKEHSATVANLVSDFIKLLEI